MTAAPRPTAKLATAVDAVAYGNRSTPGRLAGFGLLLLCACGATDGADSHTHVAADPIRIVVAPEVRAQYRQSRGIDDKSINTWETGTLQFGKEPPTSCQLHARGRTTKQFARKSYTVKLLAKQPVLPGKKLRRLFLLNLGFDPHHFEMRFAYSCLADFDLFPPRNQLVRLFVNNDDEGIYLLCERHENAIRRAYPDVVAILRCQNTKSSLKWAAEGINGYETMAKLTSAMELDDAEQRAQTIETLIDVDGLTAWMACNSLMQNADTSGELFLYERREPGQKVGRFGVMGWDYDDLMLPPIHPDKILEHALTWASEIDLEKAVLKTEPLARRYHQTLHRLLTVGLPQSLVESRLTQLRIALDAADPAGAADRKEAIAAFAANLQARREVLLAALTQH